MRVRVFAVAFVLSGCAASATLRCPPGMICVLADASRAPAVSLARPAPQRAGSDVPALAHGSAMLHTCAVTRDHALRCWGDNSLGQINGGRGRVNTPEVVSAVPGVARAWVGTWTTCVLDLGGAVRCFGYDPSGPATCSIRDGLDDPDHPCRLSPGVVPGLARVADLAVGWRHVCALLESGSVSCWGANDEGALGGGQRSPSVATTPIPVPGVLGAVGIAAGHSETCAWLRDGTVQCWGTRAGSDRSLPTSPQPVPGLSGVRQVALGVGFGCALVADGTVRCWGAGRRSELGSGLTESTRTPVAVDGLTGVRRLATGSSHTCALRNDGTVWCWGANEFAQLAQPRWRRHNRVPAPVEGIRDALGLIAGDKHTCVLVASARSPILCWGQGNEGQLGQRRMSTSETPLPVVW